MALARVKTWVSELLKSADLNGEFNNILNNPVALISPTTGAINFNLQAHTNLVPNAISASSGSAGQALIVSGAATIWGTPTESPANYTTMSSGQTLIGTSSGAAKSLVIGTTGQVLAVTSSNSDPAWQVLPPDGGLSTGAVSTGAVYFISTQGKYVPLAIGTSGQTLQVSTALKPTWVTVSTAASGGTLDPETTIQFYDDFIGAVASTIGAAATQTLASAIPWCIGTTAAGVVSTVSGDGGRIKIFSDNVAGANASLTLGTQATPTVLPFLTVSKPTFKTRFSQQSSLGVYTQMLVGLVSTSPASSLPITDGIYFASSGPSATVFGIVVTATVQSTLSMGVTTTAFHNYQAVVTASSSVNFLVDGTLVGTINSSNVPNNVGLTLGAGINTNATAPALLLDYMYITSTR